MFTSILLREYPVRKVIVFSRDDVKQHQMRTGGFDDPRLHFLTAMSETSRDFGE